MLSEYHPLPQGAPPTRAHDRGDTCDRSTQSISVVHLHQALNAVRCGLSCCECFWCKWKKGHPTAKNARKLFDLLSREERIWVLRVTWAWWRRPFVRPRMNVKLRSDLGYWFARAFPPDGVVEHSALGRFFTRWCFSPTNIPSWFYFYLVIYLSPNAWWSCSYGIRPLSQAGVSGYRRVMVGSVGSVVEDHPEALG